MPKTLPDPDVWFAGIELSPHPYNNDNRSVPHRRRPDDGLIDSVAVTRALRGEVLRISSRELIAAIALGASMGLSDGELSERLGMPERSIYRKRIANKIPPSVPRSGTHPRKKEVA